VDVIKYPCFLFRIIAGSDKDVFPLRDTADFEYQPLRRIIFPRSAKFEVVDSALNKFTVNAVEIVGLGYKRYFHFGAFVGLVSSLGSTIVGNPLVRIIASVETQSVINLADLKRRLGVCLKENPRAFHWTSPGELRGRINRATSARQLWTSFFKD